MSQVDKQALRSVAENATPGEWCTDERHGVIADSGLNANYYIALCSGTDHRANARYIAAANPATILALLDENEALEKRVAELAEEIVNLKAKALYWDADNTESSYEDPTDIANDLDLNPGDHFYVQVAYLDKDREYVVNDDGSVSCTQLVDSSAAVAQKLWDGKS
ncbi:ead/Ea22-like family protein [Edwardsiella tarda]|uniref:ead/Ea22-like family protein n=1 Tax=Edwardsiella tarda TaxID=636 RepID=UPI00098EC013|nr:ead/Ea22-like family protein [Edwardsiella tarda]